MEKTNWRSVGLYYFLACLWSWPFFWQRDINPEVWKAIQIPNYVKTWSYMWGPGIAAIICFYVFRKSHKREVTFQGTSLWRGIFFVSLLPCVLGLLNMDIRFLGIGILGFISILGEELGWRGFLQDALKIKSDYVKAIIIGVMWELWHFTNRTAHSQPLNAIIRVLIFMAALSVISFLLIKCMRHTKSLLIAVAIHMAVDSIAEFDMGWQAVAICIPIWGILLLKWNRQANF